VVIIGASIAGQLAAHVLARHFERVVMIERDTLPGGAAVRRGVPQGVHLHFVPGAGTVALAALLPALGANLESDGAHHFDYGQGARVYTPNGPLQPFHSTLFIRTCTRPLLEWHVRKIVAVEPRITIRDSTEVVRLVADEGARTITGVVVRSADGDETVRADLVIDAAGRQSKAAQQLAELGCGEAERIVVDPRMGYVTRYYTPPPGWKPTWGLLSIVPTAPNAPRAGTIFAVEGGQWIVTFASMGTDTLPQTHEGFLEFAGTLATTEIRDLLRDALPVSPLFGSRQTPNRLWKFDALPRFPDRFVVIGDAVCALNPIYGQGITLAALGATALGQQLQRLAKSGRALTGFSRAFQRRLARVNDPAWMLSVSGDSAWPETTGVDQLGFLGTLLKGPVGRWFKSYADRAVAAALVDPVAARTFMEVMHMVRPSTALFSPAMLRRIVWPRRLG
jgi:2-polyprenyl-6-methoxyphenol hydroxylase-like FAD-dependent oxidoreductase